MEEHSEFEGHSSGVEEALEARLEGMNQPSRSDPSLLDVREFCEVREAERPEVERVESVQGQLRLESVHGEEWLLEESVHREDDLGEGNDRNAD